MRCAAAALLLVASANAQLGGPVHVYTEAGCNAGQRNNGFSYASQGNNCEDCDAGTFQPYAPTGRTASSCKNCAPGHFTGDTGATSCEECPQGKWSSAGLPYCSPTQCDVGLLSPPGATYATECTLSCPLGKFIGSTGCASCPSGQYLQTLMSVGALSHTCAPLAGCRRRRLGAPTSVTISGFPSSINWLDGTYKQDGNTLNGGPVYTQQNSDDDGGTTYLYYTGSQWNLDWSKTAPTASSSNSNAYFLSHNPDVPLPLPCSQWKGWISSAWTDLSGVSITASDGATWGQGVEVSSSASGNPQYYTGTYVLQSQTVNGQPVFKNGCQTFTGGKYAYLWYMEESTNGDQEYSGANGSNLGGTGWVFSVSASVPSPTDGPNGFPTGSFKTLGNLIGSGGYSFSDTTITMTISAAGGYSFSGGNSGNDGGGDDNGNSGAAGGGSSSGGGGAGPGASFATSPSYSTADTVNGVRYAPKSGSQCSESCAAFMGGGGTMEYTVSSGSCTEETATLPCNTKPCDPNLVTSESYQAPDLYPVLNQGKCGGCYAFAAATVYGARLASASSAFAKQGDLPSPQWLLSCAQDPQQTQIDGSGGVRCNSMAEQGSNGRLCGNGCDGGFSITAFEFMAARGVATSSSDASQGCVPFSSSSGAIGETCASMTVSAHNGEAQCKSGSTQALIQPQHHGHCFGFNSVGWNMYTQYRIRREIHVNGIVSATLLVCESFLDYFQNSANQGTIYPHSQSCTRSNSGAGSQHGVGTVGFHEVVIVGWGIETSSPHTPYWLVKNSWGTSWNRNGYFKIERGKDTSGIEGSVCMISPKTTTLAPNWHYNPRGNFNPSDCGSDGSLQDSLGSAQANSCNLGALHMAGGWIENPPHEDGQYHAAVHAAAAHAVTSHVMAKRKAHARRLEAKAGEAPLSATATNPPQQGVPGQKSLDSVPAHTVVASHSQSVNGVNRRVLLHIDAGEHGDQAIVLEAHVHRDIGGSHTLLAVPTEHSCEASSCTAHADCCGGAVAAGGTRACGTCIATKMAAELAPPPLQTASEKEAKAKADGVAEGESKGKSEGALIGSLATIGACAAAFLVFNGAKRARARRGATASSEYSSGARAPKADDADAAAAGVEGTNPGASVTGGDALNQL
eukprot:g2229.t1